MESAAPAPASLDALPFDALSLDALSLDALSFEDALKRLETIVQKLEGGEASLEGSITLYTEGQRLKAHCEAKLQSATMRIEAIQQNDAGEAVGVKPFDAAPKQ